MKEKTNSIQKRTKKGKKKKKQRPIPIHLSTQVLKATLPILYVYFNKYKQKGPFSKQTVQNADIYSPIDFFKIRECQYKCAKLYKRREKKKKWKGRGGTLM
jgi:hypothetical protein